MSFWLRHFVLVLACIVLPFSAALFVDTKSQIERSQRIGRTAARLGTQGLYTALTLKTHEVRGKALALSQRVHHQDVRLELSRGEVRGRRVVEAQAALAEITPKGGFGWLVGESGHILVTEVGPPKNLRVTLISGHPLFIQTQKGQALDGLWVDGEKVYLVGAAPLAQAGRAAGAVLIAQPINPAFVEDLAATLDPEVTFIWNNSLAVSTLENANEILDPKLDYAEPVTSGRLKPGLAHEYLGFLPLLVPHDAEGLAFTSMFVAAPGDIRGHWVISTRSGDALREIAERQEIILGAMIATLMLAILIGLLNQRTFIAPIHRLEKHLSEIHMGSGDLELNETRVSRPFRRLVRLINMTVQKLPSRGLGVRHATESFMPDLSASHARNLEQTDATQLSTLGPPSEDLLPDFASEPPKATAKPTPNSPRSPTPEFFSPEPALEDDTGLTEKAADQDDDGWQLLQKPNEGADDAIQEAIASLEAESNRLEATLSHAASDLEAMVNATAQPAVSSTPAAKSASSIRGAPAAAIRGKPADSIRGVPAVSSAQDFADVSGGPSADLLDFGGIFQEPSITGVNVKTGAAREGLLSNVSNTSGFTGDFLGDGDGDDDFNPEATVVAPVADDLIKRSSRVREPDQPLLERTKLSSVSPDLLAQSKGSGLPATSSGDLNADDEAHFKDVYTQFIQMRKRCGEDIDDITMSRFFKTLRKNREGLLEKHRCQTVRFEVYERDGRAALKATPIRSGSSR